MKEQIARILEADPEFTQEFAQKVISKAQEKADKSGENIYICLDIGCVYYTPHHLLTTSDDIITWAEPNQ